MENKKIPKILAPCGDMDALKAAIANGADALYLGLDLFNARIRAKNFTLDNIEEAIRLAHANGVFVYVTLNIAIYDKEIESVLDYVDKIYLAGADALIVSDLGIASLIKKYYPDFEIHGSTQCTAHNLDGVTFLNEKMGASQVVLARELPKKEIEYITKNTDAKIEIFVHGAHCMSVSGQCLMSYAMGGRSGNRGECAQPCRLQYKMCQKSSYPLSLKDMSLNSHITEIIDTGVNTLKIEGRMKSADYVGGAVSIWRKLLDEKRNATNREKQTLEALFSRQGFTDGYFTNNITSKMLGVRTDENKEATKSYESTKNELARVKINLYGKFMLGKNAELTVTLGEKSVTAYGDIVEEAINAPISTEDIIKSLSKLGNTPFEIGNIQIEKDDSIMVRVSSLNALRRKAIDLFFSMGREEREHTYIPKKATQDSVKLRSALFSDVSQIPENANYFDIIFLYADRYQKDQRVNGICLPPVILDSEWNEIEAKLIEAKNSGVEYALITNIGQIDRVKKYGFKMIFDYRFNVFNGPCVDFLHENGAESVILSPELTLPQINDLKGNRVIAYGKIPIMTMHKCILKDTYGCDKCKGYLQDRQNASFYVEGIFGHRNIIYNSVPIYMADRLDKIKDFSHHFIFANETKRECYDIIEAYKHKLQPKGNVKRIK